MEKTFPTNPAIQSMAYQNGELVIVYIKRKDKKVTLERRHYIGVPDAVGYGWYYTQTAAECLSFYAKNIRKKFTLLKKSTL